MAKFLFVTRSLTGGGAERVISILSNNLAALGHEAHIVVCARSAHDYPVAPEVVLHVLKGRRSAFRQKLSRVTDIRRVLREVRPDFVLPFVDNLVYATFLASRGLRMTFVSAVRNSPVEGPAGRAERLLHRLVCLLSDSVFFQTADQAAFYPRRVQKKAFVIPNPVSSAFADAEPVRIERIERIVSLGRLEKQKNQRLLIDAFKLARAQNPALRLTIFGEGHLRAELESQVASLGMAGAVALPGRRDDAVGALKENDLFVLSSDYEGFPNALAEAMCLGMPCVSTDSPTGPRELLGDGRGILTPPNDARALADAMVQLAKQPRDAARMGERARAYVLAQLSEREITSRFADECIRSKKTQ